jgi:RHS repeat-associated protein
VTDWAGRVTTYTWDGADRLTSITRPNGTKRTLRWDAAGQLLAVEERPASGAPLAIRSYHYDTVGRVDQRIAYPQSTSWSEPAWTAGYDNDNRLTTLGSDTLTYDTDGNPAASRIPDGPFGSGGSSTGAIGTYTWNVRNQLTRVVRSDNGQQRDIAYDSEGHVITWTTGSSVVRWVVDPHGGSIARMAGKISASGEYTRYAYGIGLVYEVRADGAPRYYHYDQVGSTIALSDSSGTVVGRADYSPYGKLLGGSGELQAFATPFMFVGAYGVMTDQVTGLQEMGARWYSTHLRRFLNEDPTGLAGGENLYAYVGGNPITHIDPDGRFWFLVGAALGGGLDYAAQVASNYAAGKTGSEAWTDVSITSIGLSALGGAITGGIGGIASKQVASVAGRFVVNGIANSVTSGLVQVAKNSNGVNGSGSQQNITSGLGASLAFGAISGAAGSLVGDAFDVFGKAAVGAVRSLAWNGATLASKQLAVGGSITVASSSTGWIQPFVSTAGGVIGNTISNWPNNPLISSSSSVSFGSMDGGGISNSRFTLGK